MPIEQNDILDGALWKHVQITLRLRQAILSPGSVDDETVRSHRNCEFGQWILGPGLLYCGLPEYQQLCRVHEQFHQSAFAALCRCRNGDRAGAEQSISSGDFARGAAAMKTSLIGLRDAVRSKQAKSAAVKRL